MRTRVKICGFTRVGDARAAGLLGADAIGLVFYPRSPRHVEMEQAIAIVNALPPFVSVVGLFVDEDPARIREIRERIPLELLQFHGDESPEYCDSFDCAYIKAIRMKPGTDLGQKASDFRKAKGLLLDAEDAVHKGGTGRSFDWSVIPSECPLPLILAGGLNSQNAASALRRVRPFGLDVSSGVESAKGIKDAGKMAAFLKEVQDFDHSRITRTL